MTCINYRGRFNHCKNSRFISQQCTYLGSNVNLNPKIKTKDLAEMLVETGKSGAVPTGSLCGRTHYFYSKTTKTQVVMCSTIYLVCKIP